LALLRMWRSRQPDVGALAEASAVVGSITTCAFRAGAILIGPERYREVVPLSVDL
jgi:hypothetical protein